MSSIKKQLNKYLSKKMLGVLFLGFSSGLPLALIGSLLQTWFKISGVNIISVGMLSLIGQPYAYKFFWAPLLDRFSAPWFNFLGHRKSWILTSQLIIILIVIIMAFLSPKINPFWLGGLGLLLAIISATQDINIDAYRVEILTTEDRGFGSALFIEGYRFANLISSSLGLIIADHLGWRATYLTMASLMFIGILGTLIAEPENLKIKHATKISRAIIEPIKELLTRDKAVYLLSLVVLYKLSDVFSHSLTNIFLLDLKFSLTEIAAINKFIGILATLLGVMLAGTLMIKVNLYKAVLFFGLFQGITNLLYVILAILGKNLYVTMVVIFIENLGSGMGTNALLALLTGLCDRRYAATQFALLSSLTALARIYLGSVAGWLVKILGWKIFYLTTTIMAIPGICLIFYLKKQIIAYDPRKQA